MDKPKTINLPNKSLDILWAIYHKEQIDKLRKKLFSQFDLTKHLKSNKQ